MATFKGGNITSSFASHIIRQLSIKYNQSHGEKRIINESITNTGHGSIFLGSSSRLEGGDNTIRILVGAHFSSVEAHFSRVGAHCSKEKCAPTLKIGVFGGKCNKGEMTLDTVIRETIEEIFNFSASPAMIHYIRAFLNEHPDFYFIYGIGSDSKKPAYSYFFDVSILGDFIRIIKEIPEFTKVVLVIPAKEGMANVENYLQTNIKIKDRSSFDGPHDAGPETTIKLIEFMQERYISYKYQQMQKDMGIRKVSGMDEVKYLSFVTLRKLIAAVPKSYKLFNFTKNRREKLDMQKLLIKILNKDIIKEILSFE